MLLALFDFYLALELKGFSSWEPRTKAVVCIVGAVLLLVFTIAFIRKVGIIAILVPAVIIGALYVMNQNAGCLEGNTDPSEAGSYQKKKLQAPAKPAPTGTTPTAPTTAPAK
jgi:hypothetical protein